MKKNKPQESGRSGVVLGLGVAAVAAAAAGAYFLYGSAKGPARRKALKSWMVKMKGEVMEEVEKMQDLSEELYHAAIDKVKEKYSQMKEIDATELEAVVKRLKGHWKDIKKEVKKVATKAK
ncbi:MAG: hypothetical protein AAB917_02620 [Patescibacteria group bacterium]